MTLVFKKHGRNALTDKPGNVSQAIRNQEAALKFLAGRKTEMKEKEGSACIEKKYVATTSRICLKSII